MAQTGIMRVRIQLDSPFGAMLDLLEACQKRRLEVHLLHLYPQGELGTSPRESLGMMTNVLETALAPLVEITGGSKSWWITEWGFPRGSKTEKIEARRAALYRAFLRAVDLKSSELRIAQTYQYDWDEAPSFNIWESGHLLPAGRALVEDTR
jgi:hypothetical protein